MVRWQAQSVRVQRSTIGAGIFFAVFVVIGGLNSLGSVPSGPSLSSYATTAGGLAALDSLLDSNDHPTEQLRRTLDEAPLTTNQTVVALGQSFSRREQSALRKFLKSGGRLVTGGFEAEQFLQTVAEGVGWESSGDDQLRVSTELPNVSNVATLRADGIGAWRNAPGTVLLRGGGDDVAFELRVGAGAVVALADPSIVTNGRLAEADNAGFALAIVGPPGRAVAFAENGHGFGAASGLGALPARWKAALWFGAIAALVGACAAGKRFGPADVEPESSPPERIQYVRAVASTLSRARDRDAAVGPLRIRAATLLARRSGGRSFDTGSFGADARSLVDPVTTDDDLLRFGRVVSNLEEH